MAAQPRHLSVHMAGQMRRARVLRHQAAEISEDIAFMAAQTVDRADRYGWEDRFVLEGLRIKAMLEGQRTDLLAQARHYDDLMQDIGA